MRDITLGITFYHDFTTRAFATGIPTTLAGSPVLSVLEENNATPITAGVSVNVDRGTVTGLNEATIVATGGNGFEAGKSYSIFISTGTVGGVSVVGEVVGQFTIGQSAAAVDAANGTDGFSALKTLIDAIPTTAMRGTDSAALASVCTEGRLAELDAANLPTDIAAIPTTAMRGTDSAALASVCTEGRLAELDAGNLPTDIAAIPTTAMRGTDSAALASVCTEGRLAELDAGNLPTDIAAIPTTAMRGTDGANTTIPDAAGTAATLHGTTDGKIDVVDAILDIIFNAFVLTSATIEAVTSQTELVIPATADATDDDAYNGAIAVLIDGTDPNQKSFRGVTAYDAGTRTVIIDAAADFTVTDADTITILASTAVGAIWDRILSGATHNVANSSGRRLRQIQENGYEGGAVWIDTVNGVAGTTSYENGTVENPVDNITDANTIAAAIGLSVFSIVPGSSITLVATQAGQLFRGRSWTLALGGQDIANSTFIGASVTGIGTGTGTQSFIECQLGAVTLPVDTHCCACGIAGTQTVGAAGDIFYDRCYSGIAGTGAPVFDTGAAIGNVGLNIRHYSGGVDLRNLGQAGMDNVSLEGHGQLIVNANCTGGTIVIRGHFKITDNGSATISKVANVPANFGTMLDARDEPGQGAPPASASFLVKLDHVFKSWRNKKEQTDDEWDLYDSAGTTVDVKAPISDDGTTATKGTVVGGP